MEMITITTEHIKLQDLLKLAAITAKVAPPTSGAGSTTVPDPHPLALPAPTGLSAPGATASSTPVIRHSVARCAGYNA